jgi:hypothetical protein
VVAGITQFFTAGWAAGFDVAAITTAGIASLLFVVLEGSGSVGARMGSEAERWTERELRKLQALGCSTVSHIPFEKRDVDHVVLSAAGAWAFETKWTARAWGDIRETRLQKAAADAQNSARQMRGLLASRDVDVPMPVSPVVVLWGDWGEEDGHPDIGVAVVHGNNLREWLGSRVAIVGPYDVRRAVGSLNEWLEKRDARIKTGDIRPAIVRVGPTSLGLQLLSGVLAGTTGILAGALLATLPSLAVAYALVVLAVLVGWVLRRAKPFAAASTGWAAGCVAGAVLGTIARLLA